MSSSPDGPEANFDLNFDLSRFGSSNEADLDRVLSEKDSDSTKRSTRQAVALLREYCVEKQMSSDVNELSKTELNQLLRSFYVDARKKDGQLYSMSSMRAIRSGLARHFQHESGYDIVKDVDFQSSVKMFQAQAVQLKRQGKGKVKHHEQIELSDMQKLYFSEALDINTPKGLQRKVFIDVMLFFCRRGRENLRNITKDYFVIATDTEGRTYVEQHVDEMDKNHREDSVNDSVGEGRIYEISGKFSAFVIPSL